MQKQELQKILGQLKKELATTEFKKASSRQAMEELIAQIEQALIEDADAIRKALNEPLNDAVIRFEGSHPQLTAILNNITLLLSNMGI